MAQRRSTARPPLILEPVVTLPDFRTSTVGAPSRDCLLVVGIGSWRWEIGWRQKNRDRGGGRCEDRWVWGRIVLGADMSGFVGYFFLERGEEVGRNGVN